MSRPSPLLLAVLGVALVLAGGCAPQQPFYFFEDGDLSHYKGMATDLEVPDADVESLAEVEGASAPLSLARPEPKDIWELSLEEAIQTALANSKVLRSLGASAGTLDSLTRAPDLAPTIYNPALVESNPRFGTEAALAAFDTQFTTSVFWEKVDKPQNVGGFGTLFMRNVAQQDLGTFQAQLSKYNATGGQTSISQNVAYEFSNSPTRVFPSDWNVDVTAEFRQPLFQGAGVQFNRIAGPGAIPGFNNGVVIARLKTDVALTDFEASVRNLVSDVERAYWELYLAYRELDAVKKGRDSALETWRKINALFIEGARGGELERKAQAEEQYFLFLSQVQQRQSNLYAAERQLRYMMGLAATDGRLIRPADEPTAAKVSFEFIDSQYEALARNVDLRRQRWMVKQAELELIAAKNYLLPRVDFVGQYQWLGMGDDLWDTTRKHAIATDEYDNAFQSLTSGRFQQWQYGIQASIPLGFRKEMSGVRHYQLNLTRQRVLLKEEELEVSHQLSSAIADLENGVKLIHTNFNRRIAAKTQVEAVDAAYKEGTVTIDVLLDAQRRLAEAEIEYYRSLVQYNLAIMNVHFRKGSLLEYNGVYLAEGPWPGKAYFDARRRARSRDASLLLDYGFTQPKVISRGPYQQHAGRVFDEAVDVEALPQDDLLPEPIPTPAPERPRAKSDESARTKPHVLKAPKAPEASTAAGRLAAKLSRTRPVGSSASGSAPSRTSSARVERVNYVADDRPAEDRANTSSTPDEPDANPTPAQAAGSASGWKSVQR